MFRNKTKYCTCVRMIMMMMAATATPKMSRSNSASYGSVLDDRSSSSAAETKNQSLSTQ